jgi:LysM repeat protein
MAKKPKSPKGFRQARADARPAAKAAFSGKSKAFPKDKTLKPSKVDKQALGEQSKWGRSDMASGQTTAYEDQRRRSRQYELDKFREQNKPTATEAKAKQAESAVKAEVKKPAVKPVNKNTALANSAKGKVDRAKSLGKTKTTDVAGAATPPVKKPAVKKPAAKPKPKAKPKAGAGSARTTGAANAAKATAAASNGPTKYKTFKGSTGAKFDWEKTAKAAGKGAGRAALRRAGYVGAAITAYEAIKPLTDAILYGIAGDKNKKGKTPNAKQSQAASANAGKSPRPAPKITTPTPKASTPKASKPSVSKPSASTSSSIKGIAFGRPGGTQVKSQTAQGGISFGRPSGARVQSQASGGVSMGRSGGTKAATTTPAVSSTGVYVVKKGDTLSGIAAKHGVSLASIREANPILTTNKKYKGGSMIWSGSKIKIPTKK